MIINCHRHYNSASLSTKDADPSGYKIKGSPASPPAIKIRSYSSKTLVLPQALRPVVMTYGVRSASPRKTSG